MKDSEELELQQPVMEETHYSHETVPIHALLDILSTEPPRTINVIEMIAKSGGHICSSRQGPPPEMVDRTLNLSDILTDSKLQ